jgi:phage shock protein A
MGIFDRLTQLIKSNLNDLISKSEDPQKMLDQIIYEMNTQLVSAKQQVALVIADEKRLERQYQAERATAEEWERKAMMAVRAGDDELAKEALQRHKEHQGLAAELEKQWQKQAAASNSIRKALGALNNKIEEAKRKKVVLIARDKRARAMKSIQGVLGNLNDNSLFDAYKRQEEKIDQLEAEAEASEQIGNEYSGDVTEQKFRDLEVNRGADLALDELKRKMGVAPPVAVSAPTAGVRVDAVATQQGTETAAQQGGATAGADFEAEAAELERVLAESEARRRQRGGEGT